MIVTNDGRCAICRCPMERCECVAKYETFTEIGEYEYCEVVDPGPATGRRMVTNQTKRLLKARRRKEKKAKRKGKK